MNVINLPDDHFPGQEVLDHDIIMQEFSVRQGSLRQNKEKPGEVYHKLGYENHSSFSKSFRKFYGVSPTEFQVKDCQVKNLNFQEQVLDGQA